MHHAQAPQWQRPRTALKQKQLFWNYDPPRKRGGARGGGDAHGLDGPFAPQLSVGAGDVLGVHYFDEIRPCMRPRSSGDRESIGDESRRPSSTVRTVAPKAACSPSEAGNWTAMRASTMMAAFSGRETTFLSVGIADDHRDPHLANRMF